MFRRAPQSSAASQAKSTYGCGQNKRADAECSTGLPDELLVKEIGAVSSKSNREELKKLRNSALNRFSRWRWRDFAGQASCAIEDKDVWQALIHHVPGHGQGLEVGRNVDLASFHNLAFEFFG